jgi:hypothetical protein
MSALFESRAQALGKRLPGRRSSRRRRRDGSRSHFDIVGGLLDEPGGVLGEYVILNREPGRVISNGPGKLRIRPTFRHLNTPFCE